MACSAGDDDIADNTVESKSLKCLVSNDMIKVKLDDSLNSFLPREIILDLDKNEQKVSEIRLDKATGISLNVPYSLDSDSDQCELLLPINIRAISQQKPRDHSPDHVSPFTPVYTPNYALALVPQKEIEFLFKTPPEVPDQLKDFQVTLFETNAGIPPNYRQRFSVGQLNRQAVIKVNPRSLPRVPFLGRLCRLNTKNCAFFEIVFPGLDAPDSDGKFYIYLSVTPDVILESNVTFSLGDHEDFMSLDVAPERIHTLFGVRDQLLNSAK